MNNTLLTEAYKELLSTVKYKYELTIEFQPKYLMNRDEVRQEIRILEFKLNKFYLKSSWSKWKREDKFWFAIFHEGTGIGRHYHCSLHVPKIYNHAYSNVKNFIHNHWSGKGTIDVREIYDSSGMTRYNTKELYGDSPNVYFST